MNYKLTPIDIPDNDVRKWFMYNKRPYRTWLIPAYIGNTQNNRYFSWIRKSIVGAQDKVVILLVEKQGKRVSEQIFPDSPIEEFHSRDLTEHNFETLLTKHSIDSFFSHATYLSSVFRLRKLLLTEQYFDRVLSVWHEGGFLRIDSSRNKCFQLDWMGWNALSSLSVADWNETELTGSDIEFVNKYMKDFLNEKQQTSPLPRIQSQDGLQKLCETNKPIVFVPLQVYTDSVISHFVPKEFQNQSVLFDLAESRSDCFFVFKEHPKQLPNAPHLKRTKGKNYLYLPADSYETMSVSLHASVVLVLNSTVGFESLYWKPVIRIGKSAYAQDKVSYPFSRFEPILPQLPRSNIMKFLHYALTRFHYAPGVNVSSHEEWFNFLDTFRRQNRHLIDRQNRLLESFPSFLRR